MPGSLTTQLYLEMLIVSLKSIFELSVGEVVDLVLKVQRLQRLQDPILAAPLRDLLDFLFRDDALDIVDVAFAGEVVFDENGPDKATRRERVDSFELLEAETHVIRVYDL